MTHLVKNTFKLQDILLIALYSSFENPSSEFEITTYRVEKDVLDKSEVVIGFHKAQCKIGTFHIKNIDSMDNRVIAYLDDLAFRNKVKSAINISLKNAVKSLIEMEKKDTFMDPEYSSILFLINSQLKKGRSKEVLTNCIQVLELWIESFVINYRDLCHQTDVWNSCEIRDNIAINFSTDQLPNWKWYCKDEGLNYYVSRDKSDKILWSVITTNCVSNPLPDSPLLTWIHKSKYLAKLDSFDKVEKYLESLK